MPAELSMARRDMVWYFKGEEFQYILLARSPSSHNCDSSHVTPKSSTDDASTVVKCKVSLERAQFFCCREVKTLLRMPRRRLCAPSVMELAEVESGGKKSIKECSIAGVWYRCTVCTSYMLCSECEHRGVHDEHIMMRVTATTPTEAVADALMHVQRQVRRGFPLQSTQTT